MERWKLFEEFARVMKMCANNPSQDVDTYQCVRFLNPTGDYSFDDDEKTLVALRCATAPEAIVFAIAIVESAPVFIGDVLFCENQEVKISGGTIDTLYFNDNCSWVNTCRFSRKAPKKTIKIGEYVLLISFKDHFHKDANYAIEYGAAWNAKRRWFKTMDDVKQWEEFFRLCLDGQINLDKL